MNFSSFCLGTTCLDQEWSQVESNVPHYCPVKNCRKEICSSIVHHRDLPINQTILDLIESCNFHVEASGPCQICHHSPSFVKCSHCSLFACFECANQHRRDTLTTLTNQINTLEQDYLTMHDQIDHTRERLSQTQEKSLEALRAHYTRLMDELRTEEKNQEEQLEQQSNRFQHDVDLLIEEHKQDCQRIHRTIQELRTTITDWSTIEQFKHLQSKLTQIQEEIHQMNEAFHQRLPEMKIGEIAQENDTKHLPQTNELILINGKQHLSASSTGSTRHHLDGKLMTFD